MTGVDPVGRDPKPRGIAEPPTSVPVPVPVATAATAKLNLPTAEPTTRVATVEPELQQSRRGLASTLRHAWREARRIASRETLFSVFGGSLLYVSALGVTFGVAKQQAAAAVSGDGLESYLWKSAIGAALLCAGGALMLTERCRLSFKRKVDRDLDRFSRHSATTTKEQEHADELVRSKPRMIQFYGAMFAATSASFGCVAAIVVIGLHHWQIALYSTVALGVALGRRYNSAAHIAELYHRDREGTKNPAQLHSLATVTRKIAGVAEEVRAMAEEAEASLKKEVERQQDVIDYRNSLFTLPVLFAAPLGLFFAYSGLAQSTMKLSDAAGYATALVTLAISSFQFLTHAGTVLQEQRLMGRLLGLGAAIRSAQAKDEKEGHPHPRLEKETTISVPPWELGLKTIRFDGVLVFSKGNRAPLLNLDEVELIRGFNFIEAPAGSGKSLWCDLLTGRLRDYSGTITIVTDAGPINIASIPPHLWQDHPAFRSYPLSAVARRDYTREEVGVLLDLLEKHNVAVPERFRGYHDVFRLRRRGSDAADKGIQTKLSDTEVAQLEALLAVSGDARVIIFVEPPAGYVFLVREYLHELAARGATVIYFALFVPYCEPEEAPMGRVLELREGTIRRWKDGPISPMLLGSILRDEESDPPLPDFEVFEDW